MKRPIQVIYVTSHFERRYKKLPAAIKTLAEEKERLFPADAFDPRLGTHKLKGKLKGQWAFSVTEKIRIIFLDADEVLLHDIGPRGVVY